MATRVLFIITKSNLGGAQRYVYDLATSLPQSDFVVTVAAGGAGWLHDACTQAGVRTVTLPALGRDVAIIKDLKALWALVALIRREQPDILHLNSAKAGFSGAIAGRLAGVKRIVFTAHGWAHNERRPFYTRAFFWILHAVTMLLADVTIANSNATARDAPLHFKLKKVYLGIREPEFLPRETAMGELGIEPHGVMIGTIAELHQNKGLDVLVDALAHVHDAHAVVIGGGEERDRLVARAQKKGSNEKITFLGHIDNAARYLHAFDIFVLPSRTESFGYVLVEAGYAGLPVVASEVGGIPEIIKDGVSGILVAPESPAALARALQVLVDEPALRTRLGATLNEKIRRDFSLTRMVEETIRVYQS